jgi:hypothetical protein
VNTITSIETFLLVALLQNTAVGLQRRPGA